MNMTTSRLKGVAEFRHTMGRLRYLFQREAMTIARVEGQAQIQDNFETESFEGEKWPDITEKRKAEKRTKHKGKLPKILTDSGDLKKSVRAHEEGRDVVFTASTPYARRHNEGFFGMPRRQFMGPGKRLDAAIRRKLDKGIGKLLNRF